ncbi:hypothetical protein [Phaeacidiphilus oryzae]|uniref:hypothetical protein n=1 Tax=Phaeacidiphilus oryzae TaxID=348818 RepID=UPI00055AA21B|nr:hypothetical protein [Phaeacidiphilus oryzae]
MTGHSDDLPLPEYDQLSVSTIAQRIRPLGGEQLEELLTHEGDHAARPAVLEVLTARLHELESGAEPSPGGEDPAAGPPGRPAGGSPVSPSTARTPVHPPPHGNPAQPARPKGDRG